MEKRIIVSGGNEIRTFSLPQLCLLQRIRMEGAGPLAAHGSALFCACNPSGVIWRLSADTLVPQALFSGGPGVCDLALSVDAARLYALCGEGDSVLMLDAVGGYPMMLACVGLGPRELAVCGDELAVAGGESGAVSLLHADTLQLRAQLPMPGPVYAVSFHNDCVHALCLSDTLSSILVSCRRDGGRRQNLLSGMPGALLALADRLLIATHGRLYARTTDGMRAIEHREAAGRAAKLLFAGERLLLCDALSECLFVLEGRSGRWRPVCEHACDVIAVDT